MSTKTNKYQINKYQHISTNINKNQQMSTKQTNTKSTNINIYHQISTKKTANVNKYQQKQTNTKSTDIN